MKLYKLFLIFSCLNMNQVFAEQEPNRTQALVGGAMAVPAAIDIPVKMGRSATLDKAFSSRKPLSDKLLKKLIGSEVVDVNVDGVDTTQRIVTIEDARKFDERRLQKLKFNPTAKIARPSFKKIYGKNVLIAAGGYLILFDSALGGIFGEKPLMGDIDPVDALVGQ